jgi:hypothetical protein
MKIDVDTNSMPLTFTTLGYVLTHIYSFDPSAGIYLPSVERYEAGTPCIVASPDRGTDYESLHRMCLDQGFRNWLNIAVVSDTCDEVSPQTETCFVAAFNDDCREGGWLRRMMNYWNSDSSPQSPS